MVPVEVPFASTPVNSISDIKRNASALLLVTSIYDMFSTELRFITRHYGQKPYKMIMVCSSIVNTISLCDVMFPRFVVNIYDDREGKVCIFIRRLNFNSSDLFYTWRKQQCSAETFVFILSPYFVCVFVYFCIFFLIFTLFMLITWWLNSFLLMFEGVWIPRKILFPSGSQIVQISFVQYMVLRLGILLLQTLTMSRIENWCSVGVRNKRNAERNFYNSCDFNICTIPYLNDWGRVWQKLPQCLGVVQIPAIRFDALAR